MACFCTNCGHHYRCGALPPAFCVGCGTVMYRCAYIEAIVKECAFNYVFSAECIKGNRCQYARVI